MNPIQTGGATRRGAYFFLSYAHSAPSDDLHTDSDSDHWVRVFYDHLVEAVHELGQPSTGLTAGFIDDLVQPGTERNAMLSEALGAAEVFVALYSPGYFNKTWPLRVRESFQLRLHEAEAVDKQRHLLPVLWVPLFSWEMTPDVREALPLGDGIPAYAENGLRALCMLPSYERAYREIVRRIAARIVDVAENSPLGPSWAPSPEELSAGADATAQFAVAVAAPTLDDLPPDRDPTAYGRDPTQWRPFGAEQALPIAEYLANTAERLGLPARIVAFSAVPEVVRESAAVLLIDLWATATGEGLFRIRSTLATLPEWVMPLVLVNRQDPQYDARGAALVQRLEAMLTRSAMQIIEAQNVRQFLDSVPVLVTEARRRYLKFGPKADPVEGPPSNGAPRSGKHANG